MITIKKLWLGGVLLIPCQLLAGDVDSSLGDLDTLVGRWMALRITIAEENREWDTRREQWNDEIDLLEKEDETLKKEIDENDSFATSVEKRRTVALARKELMETELQKLCLVLEHYESDLIRWKKRIPPSLYSSLRAAFSTLPTKHDEARNIPLAKRAQTVAVLYTQIETLQNKFHTTRESLDTNGIHRQADVLYVGLARAFAISPANDWAAIGTPSDNGWLWKDSLGDGVAIRHAIDVLKHKKTAQLVELPMQITEVVK